MREAGGREPLVAVERPAVVPLSFAQSRLWFLDQLQGPSPVYNMAVALRLGGRLDVEALAAALADVVARHEIAAHHISRHSMVCPCSWWWRLSGPSSVGMSLMPPAGRRPGWRRPSRRRRVTRLTWRREIPLRARLFRVTEDEHVLVGVVHHIAADGWSITPLVA